MSVEADPARPWFAVHVDGVDEANAICAGGHDESMGPEAFAEEADPAEEGSIGDTAGSEDDVAADGQVASGVDAIGILDTHFSDTLGELRPVDDEPADHFTVQAAHGRSSEHTLRSATNSHDSVDPIAPYRNGYSGREIAVADEANAGA